MIYAEILNALAAAARLFAELGAGTASTINAYQPELPAQLVKKD